MLIAKLEAYGFDHESLEYVYSYLSDRKQRTKINNSFSPWSNIKFGVPQGSILGPLLFNIYLNDIFYFCKETDITNYADDTTPFAIAEDIVNLARDIKTNSNDVVISGLVARNDDLQFKGQQVNEYLVSKCIERNLFFIDNNNINPRQHLNSTNHLNYKGTDQLMNNFLECINY